MKHILHAVLLLAIPLVSSQSVSAQVGISNPYGPVPVCPGRPYSYTATTSGNSFACRYEWTPSSGATLQDPNNSTFPVMRVTWPDVGWAGDHNATLKVKVYDCNNTAANGTSAELKFYIRSITNKSIGPISVAGDLSFGSTSVITLSVARVEVVPPDGNVSPPRVQEFAGGYTWTIPANWQYVRSGGNITSTGAPQYFADATANQIQVIPAAPGTSASFTVTAKDALCDGQGSSGTVSSPAQLTVQRPTPALNIISDRTPNGGNLTLGCGDRNNYHWRLQTAPLPAGGSIQSYNWSVTGISQGICCGSTASPLIVQTGSPGTGTVNTTVTYCRNGACTPITVPAVTVTVANQVQRPQVNLSNNQLLCPGETITASVVNPVSGLTYNWSAVNSGLVITPLNTTASEVSIEVPVYVAEGFAQLTVTAGSSSAGCIQSEPGIARIVVGRAFFTPQTNPITLMVGTEYGPNYTTPVPCNTPTWLTVAAPAQDLYGNPLTNFRWDVDGVEPPNSANQLAIMGSFRSSSQQGGQVTLIVTNRCGAEEYYWWQVPVTNTCGGPIGPQPCDCGGGLRAAYPNPANDALIVEQEPGTVTLRNNQGKAVFEGKSQQGKLTIDTRNLPEGLYYLEHKGEGSKGKALRRQISIKH